MPVKDEGSFHMKKKKRALVYLTAAVLLLAGCGSSSGSAEKYENAVAMEEAAADSGGGFYEVGAVVSDGVSGTGASAAADKTAEYQERKLIRDVDMSVETAEFDDFLKTVTERTKTYGGYIEGSNIYNGSYTSDYRSRSADITARIPSRRLDEFIDGISAQANVMSKSESVRDVTLEYVDPESHKKALLAEQKSLLLMLEKAETIEDIIAINQQLTDVRYQIESMESQLRTYDNQIDYSTVWISVSETAYYEPYEEKGTWERISSGFSENVHRVGRFFKNFGIEFVIALPIIVPVALVTAAVILLVRWMLVRSEKKQKKRREFMRAQSQNASGQAAAEAAGAQSLNERYRGSADISKEKEQEGKEKDT